MQCKELEAILELEGLSTLPPEAREHLAGCHDCQDLLSDLSTIVASAKSIPAEVAPPDRIWVSLCAQLEAEGVIRQAQPVAVTVPTPWWNGLAVLFRPRTLAGIGASLFLLAGSVYLAEHRTVTTVRQSPFVPDQTPRTETAKTVEPTSEQPKPTVAGKKLPPTTITTAVPPVPRPPRSSTGELKPSPSENAYLGDSATVLSTTENALPRRELANNAAVDASFRQSLRTLNGFIAECEARLKQNPQDQLAREYLNMAYQQKAELLTSMMDNGRSEH
jgi:hypothetical protein